MLKEIALMNNVSSHSAMCRVMCVLMVGFDTRLNCSTDEYLFQKCGYPFINIASLFGEIIM